MGSLTEKTPKSLLPLGKHTILDYILTNIDRANTKKVYLAVDHMKEQIISHIEKVRDNYNMDIDFLYSKSGADTAGAILGAKELINDDFFVTVGDDITNLDFKDFSSKHRESKSIASIASLVDIKKYEYGVLDIKDGYVTGFKEKPTTTFFTNIGSYFFKPQIFDYIEFGDDFAKDIFPKLLKKNMKIYSYSADFFWYSIGNLQKYNYYKDNLHLIEKYF